MVIAVYRILAAVAIAALCFPVLAEGLQLQPRLEWDNGGAWRAEGLLRPAALSMRTDTVDGKYRFDAWRVTLRYALVAQPAATLGLGMTTRGRELDAYYGHSSPDMSSPMLHAFGEYRFGGRWRMAGDLDAGAASGSRGHALDLGLRLAYDLSRQWSVAAGYQLHDQSQEVDELVGPGRSNFFTLGTRLRF